MPARRELTLEDVRAASRATTARWRAKQAGDVTGDVTVTSPRDVTGHTASLDAQANGHAPARSFPVVTSSPTEKRDNATGGVGGDELAEVGAVLAPFAARGKLPTRRYLERLRLACPDVDLVAAALEAADWLAKPEHLDRECNSGFLGGWVRRTDARQKAAPAPRAAPVVETDPERAALRRLVEGGARSAVGRAVEMYLEHPPEAPSTWRH